MPSVVLITGGAQGLGLAYAHRLRNIGARVIVADINAEALAALDRDERDQVREGPGVPITGFATDVTDRDQVVQTVKEIGESIGDIDVLINNAGGALLPRADFESFDLDEWRHVIDVNLTSQWICASAVVPMMKRAGRGKIINVTSSVVERGYPTGMLPYISAKAGVVGFTRALARELGPFGITVNAIAPGYTPVRTPKVVHDQGQAAALAEQMLDEQCIKRTETPDDLSAVVEFLASAAADFVTGQVIHVDGGWVTA